MRARVVPLVELIQHLLNVSSVGKIEPCKTFEKSESSLIKLMISLHIDHGNAGSNLVAGNENGPSEGTGQPQKRKYTKRKERTRRSNTTSDGMRICPECNSSFSSYSSLYVHKKSHLNVRYECGICKEDFKWPYMLYNHRKNVHGAVTPGRRGRPKKDNEGHLPSNSNHHASGANNGLPSP